MNPPFLIIAPESFLYMGKGDKKTKKGKIAIGTYGNSRRRNAIKAKLKRSASRKLAEPVSIGGGDAAVKPRRTVKKKSEG